jgi:outer membrane protein assembly factor BamB
MRYRLLIFALLAIVILAGCVGTRQGVSWPTLSLVELDGEQQIIVAYQGQVDILSPSNGALAPLINPATGEIRRDEENNARNWVLSGADYENAQFYSNPIRRDEETLVVADHNNRLLEIDTVTATVVRTIPLEDHVLADILVVDGVMVIPLQSSGVTAITIDDYEVLWSYPIGEGVWAKPILVNDMIVFTSPDHYMYAVDKTGELHWKVDLEGAVASTPLLANDRLYVGSFNKKFFEVSLDGDILNTYDTQNWVWGTPAIDEDGIVYVTDLSGYVHALDTTDNLSEIWSVQVATRGIRSGPLAYEDSVIVASRDGIVYWIDRRNGVVLTEKEIDGNPELLGDLLLIEPSESLNIDKPLIIVSTVDTGKLLVAFEVDGLRQPWVYKR